MKSSSKCIHAVFFDLDDTLCHASDAWQLAEQETFDKFLLSRPGLTELDTRRIWETVHEDLFAELDSGPMTMAEVRDSRFRRTLELLGIDDLTLADELNLFLSTQRLIHMKPMDHALDVLAKLGPSYHLGIITNGAADLHPDSQYTLAKHLQLLPLIKTFVASDTIGFRKPDIRIFRHALNAAGAKPWQAAYIGDSLSKDINGSNRAGMTSILLTHAKAHSRVFAPYEEPDHMIHCLSELPDLLDRVNRIT